MCEPGFHALDITGFFLALTGLFLPLFSLFPFMRTFSGTDRLPMVSDLLFWLGMSVMAFSVPYGGYAIVALLAVMLRHFLISRSS
jgi:hypothetical protein